MDRILKAQREGQIGMVCKWEVFSQVDDVNG